MLQVLLEKNVKFLLVGAYAMGVHGYPRATGDIDIWVEQSAENSLKVYRSMEAFGAPLHDIDESTFATPSVVFQIGVAPRRIDIISTLSGIKFNDAFQQRQIIELERMNIPILSLGDLIRNKRATGRDKDRLDADRLEKEKP